MSEQILVVDDEEGVRTFIAEAIEAKGRNIVQAADGLEAWAMLEKRHFHLLITDLKMPRMDGMELLLKAKEADPDLEVIVLTAHGTVENAVSAMRAGAFEYLTKPLSGPDELRLIVGRALEQRRLKASVARAEQVQPRHELLAFDPAMKKVVSQLTKVAQTSATVLLLGESGTGKEVAARAVHKMSQRAHGPFVAVNCAAMSPQLIESEILGHERGAFTGATELRRGRFELADGGTLFLDEVAELPAELQSKLLRVLQEKSFERVGGAKTIHVDVRFVAATNRQLEQEMAAGRFREDLYHRLAVFPVHLPPLRERPGDILPLAHHLLEGIARQFGQKRLVLDEQAANLLQRHSWPGNVRELGNALERAAILADGETLTSEHFMLTSANEHRPNIVATGTTLRELERVAIQQALASCDGHRKKAAEALGIGLRTLYEKIKEYGL
jgi:two-component system response regulator FlrC